MISRSGVLSAVLSACALGLTEDLCAQDSLAAIREYHDALRLARDRSYGAAFEALQRANRQDPSFPRAYGKIIWVLEQTKETEKAREYFESLLAHPSLAAYGHYALALLDIQQRNLPKAEVHLKSCIDLAPEFAPAYTRFVAVSLERGQASQAKDYLDALLAGNARNGAVRYALAYLSQQQGNAPTALEHLKMAKELAPGLWELLDVEYSVYYRTDRFPEALGVLDAMLQKAEQSGHLEWKSHVLGRMGMIHSDLASYKTAISRFGDAIAIARDLGDRAVEQAFQGQLALVYFNMANYPGALRESRAALALAQQTGNRLSEGRNLGIIASIHAENADYAQAIDSYQRAIDIARETGDRASEADQLASLAIVDTAVGYHAKALSNLQTAIAVARTIKNPWLEGRFLQALGQVYRNLERYPEALEAFDRALMVARRIGDRLGEASRLALGAEIRGRTGGGPEALRRYEQALQISQETGAALIEGRIRNDLGSRYLRLGRTPRALEHYRKALALGVEAKMPEVIWQARAGLAAVHEQEGQWALARTNYQQAVEAIEQVRSRLGIAEEKAGFLEGKLDVYTKLIALLVRLHEMQPEKGYYAEAFQYAECARARSSLDLLSEAGRKIEAGVEPGLAERQRQLERRLSRLQAQLIESYSGKSRDPDQIRTLGLALDRADEEYRTLRREIRDKNPRYAELRYPDPVSLGETKAMLGEKTLLLEYVLGKDSSFLFAVTRDDHLVVRLPGTSVLTPRITKLREAISTQPSRANLSNYWLQAQSLYRELIAPAGRLLTGRDELIVAADGILHYLPFNALLKPQADLPTEIDPSRLPYLARDYAVSYIPSASVLATVRRDREARSKPDKMFLAYADPSYDTNEPSAHPGRIRRSLSFASVRSLPRLENSRKEVERIAALYPANAAEVFLGERATEENVKDGALERYRIVHFAAHGMLNEENPQFSGLLLSRPTRKESDEGKDGLLQVYEIFNLKLNADIVVLSACQTGLGRAVKGEGLVGMTQAFFYAGTSSVLVSLWNVEDRSTAELMIRFHRHIRRGDLNKAQALRRAQLELIGKTSFAHPYYWAAFSLTGDSRSVME